MKFEPTDITRMICELDDDRKFLSGFLVWADHNEYDRKSIQNTMLHIDKTIEALDTLRKILYTVQ